MKNKPDTLTLAETADGLVTNEMPVTGLAAMTPDVLSEESFKKNWLVCHASNLNDDSSAATVEKPGSRVQDQIPELDPALQQREPKPEDNPAPAYLTHDIAARAQKPLELHAPMQPAAKTEQSHLFQEPDDPDIPAKIGHTTEEERSSDGQDVRTAEVAPSQTGSLRSASDVDHAPNRKIADSAAPKEAGPIIDHQITWNIPGFKKEATLFDLEEIPVNQPDQSDVNLDVEIARHTEAYSIAPLTALAEGQLGPSRAAHIGNLIANKRRAACPFGKTTASEGPAFI